MRHRSGRASRHHLYLFGVLLFLFLPLLESAAQIVQDQPIQPLQPIGTEEPDDRPVLIPTLDPVALPTRPSLPTATAPPTRAPRVTPTPRSTEPVTTPDIAPATEEPSPTPETQALQLIPANLTIHKGACPASDGLTYNGFDPYGDHGIQAFQQECPLVDEPIQFTVSGSDGFEQLVDTGVGGEVQIGVPAGSLTVAEIVPDIAAVPAVYCYSDKALIQADAPPTYSPFANWDAKPGEDIHCWFFNIAKGERFVVLKFVCPDGASPLSDQLNPFVFCTELMPGVEFIATDATGEHSRTTAADDTARWDDLQQRGDGTISVREVIPDGYGEPAYFCGPRERLDVSEEFGQYVLSQNGEITLSFDHPGQAVDGMCVVFNTTVGADEEAGHDITIGKLSCPPGYDATNVPLETLLADCAKHPGSVEFTVTDGGAFSATQTTVSPDIPIAYFDNVPAGSITITETVPAGYEPLSVWCSDQFNQNSAVSLTSQPLVNGNGIVWDYAADSRLVCIWFNIGTGEAPDGDNVVTVHKWRCNVEDTGYDPVWPLDNLLATCTEAMNDVEFTLTAPNGVSTQTTANGLVEWTGLPEGPFSIQETIPDYYDHPVVFCNITIPNGGGPMVQVPSANGLVEFSFGVPGSAYTCHWFNIDLGEYSIRVYKRICPDTVLYGGSLNHYQTECTVPMPNVEFTATTAQGTVTGDTNFSGIVVLSPIPAGPFTLKETIPVGYGEPIVFCEVSANHGGQQDLEPFQSFPTVNGQFSGEMPLGGHIDCWWFNLAGDIPPDDGTVEVTKWHCPEGATLAESNDWYQQNCAQPHDGVTFTLTTANGTASQATAGGAATFTGVPAGQVGLQEAIPAGYGEPVVLCEVDGSWFRFPAPTGYVSRDLAPGGTVSCHWFNIPGGPGDITIVKHACVAGFDPYAAGADPKVDCPELADGIEFSLDGPASATATTGDVMPGVAHFGNLDPGLYTVTETVPDGIASVFVTECTGHLMGELQPYPLSTDETLDIDLASGEHITCHWYNVPEDDGGTVTVIKYTCSTATFVSEVDCQIEEDGVTFDLLDGSDAVIATATTDGVGRITWTGLASGDYWLAEHGGEWCRILAAPSTSEDTFGVNDGQETLVEVWNCGGEPGTPGDTPTKYPNTGVGSASALPLAFQQAVPQRESRGFFTRLMNGEASWLGPFAVLVPFIYTVVRMRDIVIRGRENRERQEEEQWYEEAALVRQRPGWMATDASTSRTVRPAWMSADGSPQDTPRWLSDNGAGIAPSQPILQPLDDAPGQEGGQR